MKTKIHNGNTKWQINVPSSPSPEYPLKFTKHCRPTNKVYRIHLVLPTVRCLTKIDVFTVSPSHFTLLSEVGPYGTGTVLPTLITINNVYLIIKKKIDHISLQNHKPCVVLYHTPNIGFIPIVIFWQTYTKTFYFLKINLLLYNKNSCGRCW